MTPCAGPGNRVELHSVDSCTLSWQTTRRSFLWVVCSSIACCSLVVGCSIVVYLSAAHLLFRLLQDEVQKKMDKCVKELEDLAKAKEKELNTV